MAKYHLYIYICIIIIVIIITYYYILLSYDFGFLIIGSLFLSKQNIQAFQEKIVLLG